MNGKVFFDTNVFIYTQSENEPNKRSIALKALDEYDCCTSTQVFNEVCNVMIKKLKMRICEVKQVIAAINDKCEVYTVSYEAVQKALDIKERYNFSYYDSLILSSAILSGCKYLLSEDLQNGQKIDGAVEIVNIFKNIPKQGL